MKGSKGKMHGTRRKLRKRKDIAPNQYLRDFSVDEKVQINIEPSSHRGMPSPRFQGKIVRIFEKEGDTYIVKFKEGGKEKKIKTKPVHLKKIESED